jgi:hypothetical protein
MRASEGVGMKGEECRAHVVPHPVPHLVLERSPNNPLIPLRLLPSLLVSSVFAGTSVLLRVEVVGVDIVHQLVRVEPESETPTHRSER